MLPNEIIPAGEHQCTLEDDVRARTGAAKNMYVYQQSDAVKQLLTAVLVSIILKASIHN